MGFLSVRTVTKRFGQSLAVDSLDLDVKKGEFLTILGPSGCGKTTTLRLIAGFESPDSGEILINDKPITNTPPNKRNIGFVFQNYALFPHMNVYENLAFGLKTRKYSKDEIDEKVKKVLELVRLAGFENRFARQMSGGQQQRIALARSMIIEPDVLLMDEPLSNLDFKLRQMMRTEITNLHKTLGITTVYVTHDQGEALSISDRVAVMHNGKLVQLGTPLDIYSRPETTYVADFIGESNILDATVDAVSSDSLLCHIAERIPIRIGLLNKNGSNQTYGKNDQIHVSIRPELIQMSKSPTSDFNVYDGKIESIVFSGSSVKYYVRLGDNISICLSENYTNESLKKAGEQVKVFFSPDDCVICK